MSTRTSIQPSMVGCGPISVPRSPRCATSGSNPMALMSAISPTLLIVKRTAVGWGLGMRGSYSLVVGLFRLLAEVLGVEDRAVRAEDGDLQPERAARLVVDVREVDGDRPRRVGPPLGRVVDAVGEQPGARALRLVVEGDLLADGPGLRGSGRGGGHRDWTMLTWNSVPSDMVTTTPLFMVIIPTSSYDETELMLAPASVSSP